MIELMSKKPHGEWSQWREPFGPAAVIDSPGGTVLTVICCPPTSTTWRVAGTAWVLVPVAETVKLADVPTAVPGGGTILRYETPGFQIFTEIVEGKNE